MATCCLKMAGLRSSTDNLLNLVGNSWYWVGILVSDPSTLLDTNHKSSELSLAYPMTSLVFSLNLAEQLFFFGEEIELTHFDWNRVYYGRSFFSKPRSTMTHYIALGVCIILVPIAQTLMKVGSNSGETFIRIARHPSTLAGLAILIVVTLLTTYSFQIVEMKTSKQRHPRITFS